MTEMALEEGENNNIFKMLISQDLEMFSIGVALFMDEHKPINSLGKEEIKKLYYNLRLHPLGNYKNTDQSINFNGYKQYVDDIRKAFSKI